MEQGLLASLLGNSHKYWWCVIIDCTELGVDVRGSKMRLEKLEIQRTTADCILSEGLAATHTCCFASWTAQLKTISPKFINT